MRAWPGDWRKGWERHPFLWEETVELATPQRGRPTTTQEQRARCAPRAPSSVPTKPHPTNSRRAMKHASYPRHIGPQHRAKGHHHPSQRVPPPSTNIYPTPPQTTSRSQIRPDTHHQPHTPAQATGQSPGPKKAPGPTKGWRGELEGEGRWRGEGRGRNGEGRRVSTQPTPGPGGAREPHYLGHIRPAVQTPHPLSHMAP